MKCRAFRLRVAIQCKGSLKIQKFEGLKNVSSQLWRNVQLCFKDVSKHRMRDIITATNNISLSDISPSDYNKLQHCSNLTHQQLQHSATVSPFLCNHKTKADCVRWNTRTRWSWSWHIFTQGNHHQKPKSVLNAEEKLTIFTPLLAGILNGCAAVRQQCRMWAGVCFCCTGHRTGPAVYATGNSAMWFLLGSLY